MRRHLAAASLLPILAAFVAASCRNREPSGISRRADLLAATPSASGSAEVPIGSEVGSWPTLVLRVGRVHRDQRPLNRAPWHADGGDWAFLECRLENGAGPELLIGVKTGRAGSRPFAWGEALLAAPDRASGARALALFAKALDREIPRAKAPQPLEALRFRTAVLGIDLTRGRGGGFGNAPGFWTATKWFLQPDGYEAEVYFNYNLKEGVAEFSEKDPDYRADLVAVLARVLRDGPRPERTLEDDPNLQAEGPRFSGWRHLGSSASSGQFSEDGAFVLFQTEERGPGERLMKLPLGASGPASEIFETADRIADVRVVDRSAERFVVLTSRPKEAGVWSSEDRASLLLVEPGSRKVLAGPWGERPGLPESSLSPDRRFLAISAWSDRTDGKRGRFEVLHIYEFSSGKTRSLAEANVSWRLVRWEGSQERPVALVANGLSFDKEPLIYRFMDPESGRTSPATAPATEANSRETSPDGQRSFQLVSGQKLVFRQGNGPTRDFPFHDDDARFAEEGCCEWVSERYVFFRSPRPAFIDSLTRKMSFPSPTRPHLGTLTFRKDFRWVFSHREDGLWLANVVVPGSAAP